MPNFIIRKKADGWVTGRHRGPGAPTPSDNTIEYVEVSDAEYTQAANLDSQGSPEGRKLRHTDQGGFALDDDTRPLMLLTASDTTVQSDGIDSVTITIDRGDAYAGAVNFEISGRLMQFVFVDGVAVKVWKPSRSGRAVFRSTRTYKFDNEITIDAVE